MRCLLGRPGKPREASREVERPLGGREVSWEVPGSPGELPGGPGGRLGRSRGGPGEVAGTPGRLPRGPGRPLGCPWGADGPKGRTDLLPGFWGGSGRQESTFFIWNMCKSEM